MVQAVRARVRRRLRFVSLAVLIQALALYRRCVLKRTVFIGVTGSCGKTTTKELIAVILATRLNSQKSRETRNTTIEAIRTLLRVRRSDAYCVQEMSISRAYGRPSLDGPLNVMRPKIGVVTTIGTDHLRLFGSRKGLAAAKSRLVTSLPDDGTAVLNADDPLVAEMAGRCRGLVITYGTGPNAMLRAEDVRSAWPERLTFTIQWGDESHLVQTQLCGALWVSSVLAALAVGLTLGVPLRTAVEAVRAWKPIPGRMSPEALPSGVTFIRDDFKAPLLSFPPALDFMERARAPRKIVIVGTISDYNGASKGKYLTVARRARAAADHVFFVGRWAPHCLPAKTGDDDSLRAFASIDQLVTYLRAFLRSGDLVLLKGSPIDRLWSVIPLIKTSNGSHAMSPLAAPRLVPATRTEPPIQLVVGLGNPGRRYERTRHNVGYRVVDMLAARLGARWERGDQAMVARAEVHGRPVCLVKLLTGMNASGPALRGLGERLKFSVAECLLVHDDVDLPVGKVRERMRGSAGGHNGVLSILTTYQSEEFRRVKVGVGQPPDKARMAAFVLSPVVGAEEPAIRDAVAEACTRILRLVALGPLAMN